MGIRYPGRIALIVKLSHIRHIGRIDYTTFMIKKMKYFFPMLALFSFFACTGSDLGKAEGTTSSTPGDTATWVIMQAISRHGGDQIDHSRIAFDFRDRHYISERNGGLFTYERNWQDSTGKQYRDVLTNTTLYREIDGQRVDLNAKDSSAYANSTNSVLYFALLPYNLQDAAVQKKYLGKSTIKGQEYYKVKVTFGQEGGGKDHEDEYIYWFHAQDFTMDYLAYNYLVDGGGARFREAYNIREIEGIRFADYINYQPEPDSREVGVFDSIFVAGGMTELSRIETENIEVRLGAVQ